MPVSATKGTNVDRLVGELWSLLPAGPPLYGPEMLTDRSERFLAGELIREQLFLSLRQEIPYAVAVIIEEWEEREGKGDVVISATIIVEREGQRAIILGHKGEMIREIGTQARGGISDLLQRPAHLKLHIKVHPDWTTLPRRARALRIRAVSRLTAADSSLPLVALLGRPNVGKSSLFNRLVGGQPALVEDEPGITRDRRYGVCEWGPARFRVVDTGGLDPLADGHPGARCASRRCARSTRPTSWRSWSTRARA